MTHSPRILCIGAAHLDIKARPHEAIIAGCSNPVALTRSLGGVALNIARNIDLLGGEVGILSILADDDAGIWLQRELMQGTRIERRFMHSRRSPTASYTAVLDVDGGLYVALADMAIYDELTPELLEPLTGLIAKFQWLVLDANLPEATLAALCAGARRHGQHIAFNPVSVIKARKLGPLLGFADLLVCNADEAAILFDVDRDHLAEALAHCPVTAVAVTLGAEGVIFHDRSSGEHGTLAPLPLSSDQICDVTGAGDALAACLVHALCQGRPLGAALQRAQRLAAATVTSCSSVLDACHPVWDELRQQS